MLPNSVTADQWAGLTTALKIGGGAVVAVTALPVAGEQLAAGFFVGNYGIANVVTGTATWATSAGSGTSLSKVAEEIEGFERIEGGTHLSTETMVKFFELFSE